LANTLLTISKITNEALMVLENSLPFTSQVSREYDDQFAVIGAKIGQTVNIRRPIRVIGTTGPALNVEDLNETFLPVTLTTQFHTDTQLTEQDLALAMDLFSSRVLKPQIAAIANKVERDGLLMAKNNTANTVGVAGTAPTGLQTFLTAAAYLDAEAAPRDGERACIIEPFTNSVIVDSLKGLFTPSEQIAEQYRRGLIGRDAGGMNWKLSQNVISHTYGAWATTVGALTANGSPQGLATGWASTSTLSIATTQTLTLQQGDTFQIAGVNAVNPQSRQPYGSNRLRNFVVITAVTQTGAGNFNVTVSPALIYGGQFQNVSATPAAGAVVTPFSIAGTTATAVVSPQNIVLHKDAFTLAMADLGLPRGVDFAGRSSDAEAGISIRVVRQYTINNDSIPTRLDVLYGWAPLYIELACRAAA
jgi:hypothetical protein